MDFKDLCMFLLPYISLRALLPQLTEAHRSSLTPGCSSGTTGIELDLEE